MLTELTKTNPEYFYGFAIAMALAIVVASMRSILSFSLRYRLFDRRDSHRKNHKGQISRLGGVAMLASFTITVLFFSPWMHHESANFLIIACFILGAMGLKDDVYGTSILVKFILQIAVALILLFFGGYRLTSLYGVFGIEEMNVFWGSMFSVILIIFLSNIFNLIDGIDGLAASIGLTVSACFGILFAMMHQAPYALIAFALFGTSVAFLWFNWYPAKIFMGDTGALIIGLIAAVLAIRFIELNKMSASSLPAYYSAPAIAVSILIVPIFDSLRIFTVRILNRKSPFRGDRKHIHHRLQQLGLRPDQIVMILVTFNVFFVASVFLLQSWGNFILICLMIFTCALFNFGVTLALKKKVKAQRR